MVVTPLASTVVRAVVQRVARARVTVGDEEVGAIGPGLCILVGVTHDDDTAAAGRLADKVWHLRVMDDDAGVMNRSVADTTGQCWWSASSPCTATPAGDGVRRGSRPLPPEVAEPLVAAVVDRLRDLGATVATGRFRADMHVEVVNDGPVTVVLEL